MLQPITYFRFLARAALVVYFLAAVLFLGVRYWVLPNIDQWRPQIAQQLSLATGTKVTLGQVSAQWHGLNPRLQIQDISFTTEQRGQVLHLPQLKAVLSWRSIFSRSAQFASLEAHGLSLKIRRDNEHKLWVMGQPFQLQELLGGNDTGHDDALLRWALNQRHVALTGASVQWLDETRAAAPLILSDVDFVFQGATSSPRVFLRAVPPQGLGTAFELRGQLDLADSGAQVPVLDDLRGRLYVHVDDMVAKSWSPWVDISPGLNSGKVSLQGWLAFEQGRAGQVVGQASVRDARWAVDANTVVQARAAKIYVAGKASDYAGLYAAARAQDANSPPASGSSAPPQNPGAAAASETSASSGPSHSRKTDAASDIDVSVQAEGLEIHARELIALPVKFDGIALRAGVGLQEGGEALRASIKQAHLVSRDMDLQLQGSWSQGGSGAAGLADINGMFKRASLSAIDEHLPNTVNLDAREWLAKGLLGGQLENATVKIKGDLEDFPWGDDRSKGDFLIAGDYVGGIIDYLPAEHGKQGWPRLTDMNGKVSLHRVDLRIMADQAKMWPTDSAPILLRNVVARIPNIEDGSVLGIQGETQAAAQTYLALAEHSPLGGLLDGQLAEASAQGNWEVPLQLRIPLLNSDDTTVSGTIRFDGNSFRLMPEMPAWEKVKGELHFSDTGVNAENLNAEFLGGAVAFSGGVGGARKGLQMRGQITAQALADYVGLAGMKRLKGQFPYQMLWQRAKSGGSVFTVDSSLKGLNLDLPQPWGKAADEALPLHARWARAGKSRDMALDIALGTKVKASMLHREGSAKGPYFYAGNLAVGQETSLPPAGMTVDVRFPFTDLDAWENLSGEFSQPLPDSSGARRRPLLPDLQQLRVQSRQLHVKGLSLDEAVLTVTRPQPERWRMDVVSAQTSGTVAWNEAVGKKPGTVEAHFERLALGSADKAVVNPDDKPQADLSENALDDIPSVQLQVDKLILYGHMAGSLSATGVNQERGKLWRLDKFSLTSPSAQLSGTGQWRLSGENRGLTLKADAKISSLGQYMDQLGFSNIVQQGKGTLNGEFFWRHMPWRFDVADLSGKVDVKMEAGRFKSVSSRSARLLELLSLQSIQRLATLNISPASLFREGFPFDRLYGTLHIDQGIMDFNNYHVEGPAGNISIGGDVNLATEKLNLQAMVVPNLDMSGATIAAGIALNPIIGVGAFLTQWLLRNPLARAMSVHYHVSGDWDDPKLDEVPAPSGAQPGSSGPKKKAGPDMAQPSSKAPEVLAAP